MSRVSRRTFVAEGLALSGGLGLGAIAGGMGHLLIPPREGRTAEAATAAQPRRGGTLVAAAEVDPVSLDPHTNSNFSAAQGFEHLYESLTGYDERNRIVPMLAQKWEVQNAGKTYVFHLRPNVKFHNGQTMTAEDVKYSIDRVVDPKTASPWRSWFDTIEEIKVIDPLTVQMNLSSPYPGLLGSFAGMRASGIIPKGLAERENLKVKAIGTGPFKLVDFVPQDHITYARHPDYWDQPLPYLDGMTFKVLTEENAREAALRAGQIQYASINAQGAEQLARVPGVKVLKGLVANVTLHYINVSKKPLSDWRVRKAIRMAVDTNEVIQKAVFGAAVPSGPIPTGYGDWYIEPRRLPYQKPDVEGAKKLLAEAGYPGGGFKIEIKCSPQYPSFVATALVVQDSVKKLGIDAQVVQQEWGTFVKDNDTVIKTGGKEGGEIFTSGNSFRPDPDGYIYPYFHTGAERNYGGYSNPKLEPLMQQARSIFNHDQRRSLYVQIQRTLLEESPNWWWYVAYNLEATSARLQGYSQSFTGRRFLMKKAWLSS